MRLTDELLIKYADGLLDDEMADQIARLLEHDEVAAGRVRHIQASGRALRAEKVNAQSAFPLEELEALISQDSSPHLEARSESKTTSRKWAVAACIAALISGVCLGALLPQWLSPESGTGLTQHPVWVVRVVDYHTLYVRETLPPQKASGEDVGNFEKRFSAVLAEPLRIPALSQSGLEFRRAQLLKFETVPIIQLAYMPLKAGRPVALCVRPASGTEAGPHYALIRGMGAVRWTHSGLEYLLVGYIGRDELLSSANAAIREINDRVKS